MSRLNTNRKPLSDYDIQFATTYDGYLTEQGISRRQLCEHMGVSYPYIWQRLKGFETSVTINMVSHLAEMVNLSPSILMTELNRRVSYALDHQNNK
ncbi:hypothetical protein ACUXZ5_02960 [Alloscardovia omnicolens]|uniref:helix-turn-helix domain-containing protein n=1 Tax=Alloscardovia omnicolens TaxID=419015 RepID=UPI00066620FF|nr:helix-turn-helix transcriptional regulator [Alloscardovia omnicolens]